MRPYRLTRHASGWDWMTEVEYTEKALDHLGALDPQVADRVINKVDEATGWTEHRLEFKKEWDPGIYSGCQIIP